MAFILELLGQIVIEYFLGFSGAFLVFIVSRKGRTIPQIAKASPNQCAVVGFFFWVGVLLLIVSVV